MDKQSPAETNGCVWLDSLTMVWERNKAHADAAIAQLSEEQMRRSLDSETNSVAVMMKHVAGYLRSRWTDFLSADGEKVDRDRDGEFIDDYPDRDAMLAGWEAGWRALFDELATLAPEDALRTVEIRGCSLSVPEAIFRSISHCSYHIGQIVQTARVVAGEDWRPLTIPRGESEKHNRERWGRG